jgi:Carbon starvation protein CstA
MFHLNEDSHNPWWWYLTWGIVALAASISLAIALGLIHSSEKVNALWIVIAAGCIYAIAYRFYAAFIATKVLTLDPRSVTPALRLTDGVDYDPTNKWVLFGHHFAAIAGAGPLIGPMLALRPSSPDISSPILFWAFYLPSPKKTSSSVYASTVSLPRFCPYGCFYARAITFPPI